MKRFMVLGLIVGVAILFAPVSFLGGSHGPHAAGPGEPFNEILEVITNLQNKVDNLPTYNSQYVPFTKTIYPKDDGFVCATPGPGSPSTERLIINSDEPLIVTTILIHTWGVNEYEDEVSIWAFEVDGVYYPIHSSDLTQNEGFPIGDNAFNVLGGIDAVQRSSMAGKLPLQLASNGGGSESADIAVWITCRAGTSEPLTFKSITVVGWKQLGSDVNITLGWF